MAQENKFAAELVATAQKIASPGKGILAADESTGTIGNRFKDINVENNEANRQAYRQLLFTTPNLAEHISGVILFEETLEQKTDDGIPFPELLTKQGIVPGIKVDQGTKAIPFTNGELYTQGLDGLDARCEKYYKLGARFAKWRAVLKISKDTPSDVSVQETAWTLARYAATCQRNGLVPIVEPEILMDGDHDISVCQRVAEHVISSCYTALRTNRVLLEGTLLKPNMVVPGQGHPNHKTISPNDVARATVTALQRSVPSSVPGITFLSGGQSEEEASVHLNAMNALDLGPRPWKLTFSYGRALQQSCLKAWLGKKENVAEAQKYLFARAQANGLAQLGTYKGGNLTLDGEGSFQKNYTY